MMIDHAIKKSEETKNEVYLAVPILIYSGMRIAECLGLSFEDFERKKNLIHIHRSLVTVDELKEDGTWAPRKYEVQEYLKQNAEPRDVLVCDRCFEIVDMIKALHKAKGIERSLLFDTLTPNNLQMKVYHMCRELKIEPRSPHKFRKTFISQLINNGADIDFVREQAGHQQISTTYNSYVFSTSTDEEKITLMNKIL